MIGIGLGILLISTSPLANTVNTKIEADESPAASLSSVGFGGHNWYWYTVGEPKKRISVQELRSDGSLIIKHGYDSLFQLGGRWFDTVQEVVPSGKGFISTYRFEDGRPVIKSTMTWADKILTEKFSLSDGSEYRNIYTFTESKQTIVRLAMRQGIWSEINKTEKDGWSPARRERQLQAVLRMQRQAEAERRFAMAEAERMRDDEAESRAEWRAIQQANDAANYAGGAARLDEMRASADSARAQATAAQRQLENAIADGLARGTAEHNRRQAAVGHPVEVAETQAALTNASSASNSPSSGQPAAAKSTRASSDNGEELARKSIQVYFSHGMSLVDVKGPNPKCYSNVFSVEIDYSPKKWGNEDRLATVLGPMRSAFYNKCAGLGKPSAGGPTSVYYASSLFDELRPPAANSVDYVVDMP